MLDFPRQFHEKRRALYITTKQAAVMCGVRSRTILQWERGLSFPKSARTIKAASKFIAGELEIPVLKQRYSSEAASVTIKPVSTVVARIQRASLRLGVPPLLLLEVLRELVADEEEVAG